MYPFIVKIKWWDDSNTDWKLEHTHILIYADSFAAAAAMAENYCDKIESIKVIGVNEEGMFFEVPGHIADILEAGGGNYNEGLKLCKS